MWEKRNNGKKRTVKSGGHQNTKRVGKLEVLRNIRSGHYQTNRDERRKIRKKCRRITRKPPETKRCSRNLIKEINNSALLLVRYSGRFLKGTKCNVMAKGFRFMPLSLVRLRTFRLCAWVS